MQRKVELLERCYFEVYRKRVIVIPFTPAETAAVPHDVELEEAQTAEVSHLKVKVNLRLSLNSRIEKLNYPGLKIDGTKFS